MVHKHIAAVLRKGLGLAAAISLGLWCATAQAAPLLPMPAFRDAYVAAVKQAHPAATVTVLADDAVEIGNGHGDSVTTNLEHAYAYYRQDPAQLDVIIAGEVATLDAAADQPSLTADKLVVLVRPASFLPAGMSAAKAPLHRALAGDLIALVGADGGASWIYPPAATVRRQLKMTNDTIWARALANTAAQIPGVPAIGKKRSVATLTGGHGLTSSVLVEPDVWDTPAMQVGGAPVVAPIEKDMVMLIHLDDAKAVSMLRQLAAKSQSDPDALTQQLLVRRNGAWEVLAP